LLILLLFFFPKFIFSIGPIGPKLYVLYSTYYTLNFASASYLEMNPSYVSNILKI